MGTPWRPRGPDDLDDEHRARLRRRVLSEVRPHRATLADRSYAAMSLLARPAPALIRTLVSSALVLAVVASATVASADALPDEPLYRVKLASEAVRLALARGAEDRAAVELSVADHRLAEAERLALAGREPDAVVATSDHIAHLANAAAELARVELLDTAAGPVVDQLKQRLADQQKSAADLAVRLAGDPATAQAAPLFASLASLAPAVPSGRSVAEGIARHAADVATQLAATAEHAAQQAEADQDGPQGDQDAAPPSGGPAGVAPPRAADAPRGSADGPRAAPPATRPRSDPDGGPRAEPPQARPAPPTLPAVGSVSAPSIAAGRQEPARSRPPARASARPAASPAHGQRLDLRKAAEAAREAARRAKHDAEKAREAAERAKEAAKRTAPPKKPADRGSAGDRSPEADRGSGGQRAPEQVERD